MTCMCISTVLLLISIRLVDQFHGCIENGSQGRQANVFFNTSSPRSVDNTNSCKSAKLVVSNDSGTFKARCTLGYARISLQTLVQQYTLILALWYGGLQKLREPTVYSLAPSNYPEHVTYSSQGPSLSLHPQCFAHISLLAKIVCLLSQDCVCTVRSANKNTCRSGATCPYFSSFPRLQKHRFRRLFITHDWLMSTTDMGSSV